jgi:hypothetical protein
LHGTAGAERFYLSLYGVVSDFDSVAFVAEGWGPVVLRQRTEVPVFFAVEGMHHAV